MKVVIFLIMVINGSVFWCFSANWDGFEDRESGLLFITITVGTQICEETIHEHHDPHAHLFDISQWTHSAMISPIPAPYTQLPGIFLLIDTL